MKSIQAGWLAAALIASSAAFVLAQAEKVPPNRPAAANAARVSDDLKNLKAAGSPSVALYVVPAMSDVIRLPGAYPVDGAAGGDIRILAARDQYEGASFELYSSDNQESVEFKVPDLLEAGGGVFSRQDLDLKVVKVWYQNGNAWFSYFADPGLTLIPELLLHDENLIKVDTAHPANYARLDEPGGSRYVWISPPRKLDTGFDPFSLPFADAPALRPVKLAAGEFKQFVLTAHAAKDAKPGLYQGAVDVVKAGRTLASIPVSLRILPFDLPLPKTYFDPGRDFLVSLMGAWPRLSPDHPAFMPILRDLRAHNILHLGPECGPNTPKATADRQVAAMKEVGFETHPIFGGSLPWVGEHDGTPLTFDELMAIKRSAEGWKKFYMAYFGHCDGMLGLGDEQGAAWVAKTRPAWRIVNELGMKTCLAGHEHYFAKAGYILDVYPAAAAPGDAEKTRRWNALGHTAVGFYANQHNGSENPAFVRRQHGLLAYLSNFSMIDNYEFAYGPWNDLAYDLYKPMVLAYPTSRGLVDTLEWEGFRTGVDDIRYATKLKQLALEAIASGNLDRVYAGRQVLQWLAAMDGSTVDLNAVRIEMIDKILALMQPAAVAR